MNEIYAGMLTKHSKFKGKVSVIAHSLGTVITYDVLNHQYAELNFTVQNYFILGSPLGLFASVYAKESYVRSSLTAVGKLYNIYHPSDLIAYRVEPVTKAKEDDLDPVFVDSPVLIPCHETAGLNQTQKFLALLSNDAKAKELENL